MQRKALKTHTSYPQGTRRVLRSCEVPSESNQFSIRTSTYEYSYNYCCYFSFSRLPITRLSHVGRHHTSRNVRTRYVFVFDPRIPPPRKPRLDRQPTAGSCFIFKFKSENEHPVPIRRVLVVPGTIAVKGFLSFLQADH